jgi:hypothetical protein
MMMTKHFLIESIQYKESTVEPWIKSIKIISREINPSFIEKHATFVSTLYWFILLTNDNKYRCQKKTYKFVIFDQ